MARTCYSQNHYKILLQGFLSSDVVIATCLKEGTRYRSLVSKVMKQYMKGKKKQRHVRKRGDHKIIANCHRENPIYKPHKLRKSDIFTTFENIHWSFMNNLKSEETICKVKTHLFYLASSYTYNYKSAPPVLRQHRLLPNLRKNFDIVIMKPDKGNDVIIFDRRIYDNAIEEIILDSSKFGKLKEDLT